MDYQEIISGLSLEAKCIMLSGKDTFTTHACEKYHFPSIHLSDGPHGLRKQVGASDHLGLNGSEPATCFPTASAVANSWDEELGEEIGQALGTEAAAQGVAVLLGPGLNIKRNPLCGRNFEYFSEDPYLAGKMAAAYIRGIQRCKVAACPKHFAVNSQETRRMASDSVLDERTMRELYLTGFEIAVKEGKPKSIMSSYNKVNGVYANENKHLLKEILRDEWGFDGAVITDWGASNDHPLGVKNGSTLEMPNPGFDSARELIRAVRDGKVREEDVNERLAELLRLVYSTSESIDIKENIDVKKHHALARKAASESIVLLKNEKSILPLDVETKVAVIGEFAYESRYQGAGSSAVNPFIVEKPIDVLRESVLRVIGYARGYGEDGICRHEHIIEAMELAKRADAVIVYLGLDAIRESEGKDREDMTLASNQEQLIRELKKINPNIIAVLISGSVVELPWIDDVKALVYTGLGGQAGATAVVDVLTGAVNPSGRLSETWPIKYADTPVLDYPGESERVEYREGLYIGYRYYGITGTKVRFPLGYGLSYTSFAYSDFTVSPTEAIVTVTNTGKRAGTEIVQLYVGKKDRKIYGPARELKGFARVSLGAGESQKVKIAIDDKAYRYWNIKTNSWEIEGGWYQIMAGASCEEIRCTAQVEIEGTNAPDPYDGAIIPNYKTGQIQNVSDEEFVSIGGSIERSEKRRIDRNTPIRDIGKGRSPMGWLAAWILHGLVCRSQRLGNPDLNILFIYNMPLRGLAKMTNGMVSMGMVDAIVMELNGWWVIGIIRVFIEFVKNIVQNKTMKHRLMELEESKR